MKLKFIAAACVAVCSTGAFAAPTTCAPGTLTGMLQTCSPEVTFYVGGASAQGGALGAVMESATVGIFDATKTRGKIGLRTAGVSGLNGLADTADISKMNTVGYIGIGAADAGATIAGKIVLVIYNKANGSFAGVNQMLTGKGGNLEEVTLQTSNFKALAKGFSDQGKCTLTPGKDSTDLAPGLGEATCTVAAAFSTAWGKDAQKKMHMALADVRPNEASPGVVKSWKPATFPAQTTGMQGFGVIVNPNLYTALITKEMAAGRLPSSCATSETVSGATYTITAACVPNLSRAEYASIVTGKITTADQLLGTTGDTKLIKLARRTDSSGTQAASNIYFANQGGYNAKLTAEGADGYADVKAAGTYGSLVVDAYTATGDVRTAVGKNTDDYAIGVVSLENKYSNTVASSKIEGALFVKLEGVSPIHTTTGAIDSFQRAGLQNGYPFAFQMQALKPTTLTGPYLAIYDKIVAGLKSPTIVTGGLAGIGYIGSGTAADTTYTRFTDPVAAAVSGGNYLPLRKN